MASITLSTGSGAYKYQFRINYSVSQSSANNTSTISVSSVEFSSGGGFCHSTYATYFKSLTIKFAGVTIASSSGSHAYAYVVNSSTWYAITNATYSSGSGTVTHNADGTKSGKFTISTTLSNSAYQDSAISLESGTVSLDPITRTFTVSYNKGTYGTGTNSTATKTYNVALTLKGAEFTRTGYKQAGWSTSADGLSKDYDLEDSYTANASITLYPYWEAASILRVKSGNDLRTITNIKVKDGENIRNIISCYSVKNGDVHQGV